ncbi:MAG: VanZ family protein [Thiomicrorhabdus sp.]|nr:VanZ family protein [Thiomicrorhabdus sp.]
MIIHLERVGTLVPTPHSEKHDSYLLNYSRTGDRRFIGAPREVQARRKDGSTFPASIVVSEISVGDEKNYIGTVRDFTEQKSIELKQLEAKATLEVEREKLLEQDWLKSTYAIIVERIQSARNIEDLCGDLLSELVPSIGAQVGLFYIREGLEKSIEDKDKTKTVLFLLATYAYKNRNNVNNRYKAGEGLVGQAALERKTIVLTDVPTDYLGIDTGMGKTTPETIMVLPVVFEDDLVGVLEIGSLNRLSLLKQELLSQIVENLGVFINSIIGRSRAEHLLQRSESQSAALKQREQQLQQANVEMKKKLSLFLRVLPLFFVMAGIFIISHCPGSKLPDLTILDMDKLLHALAYAILAMTAIFAILPLLHPRSHLLLTLGVILFCLMYGISDEYHQSFIPSRTASIWDIMADLFGAAMATAIWHLSRWDKLLPAFLR